MAGTDERQVASQGLLESILRGAAKVLDCNSANLITFNTKAQEVRIQVGAVNDKYPKLKEIESIAGDAFQSMVFRLEKIADTMVYAAWRDRAIYETSSLGELVGSVFPGELISLGSKLLENFRFICVPVFSGDRAFGVMIFTKEEAKPVSAQQRGTMLMYARRIGEIIECDLSHRGAGVQSTLTQAQLLYYALGETAPTIIVDPKFRITSCNEATEQLLGYTSTELVNIPVGTLFEDPRDIEDILSHQFVFVTDGFYEDTASLRHKSGRVFNGRVEALLLADESDQFIGFMVMIRDSGSARTGALSVNVSQLMRRERLATMGEMAAQLAHEIRNPLVSIGATLEMLGNEEGLDGEVKEILAGLAGEVQRLDTLLKDYLSLAVRRNTLVTKVDLSAVLDDAVRLLGDNAMKGGGKTVTNLLPRGSFEVLADYDAMRHVVLNLVRNALEAVGEGGKVECGAERSGGEIKLYVDDNGPGLSHPPDECFKSFFTTKRSGTGLGLTICLKIVSAYGGTIRLGNRPGGGCRATVSLPGRVQG